MNFASRGRGLMGKPVTESNLTLCVPAQIPAVLARNPLIARCAFTRPNRLMCV
jgi:hypothetical protein